MTTTCHIFSSKLNLIRNFQIILKKDLEKHVTHVGELLAERDAMLKRINEAESNLQLTKENFQSDVKELHGTKAELESSKQQIAKCCHS